MPVAIRDFATINGLQVMLRVGELGEEPSLYVKINDKLILITHSSNEYENDLGDFMLNTNVTNGWEVVWGLVDELAKEVKPAGYSTMFILKDYYYQKFKKMWDAF